MSWDSAQTEGQSWAPSTRLSILGIGGYLRVLECVFFAVQLTSASYTESAGVSLPHRQSAIRAAVAGLSKLGRLPAQTKCASSKSLFRNTLPVTPLYGILCEPDCKVLKSNGLRLHVSRMHTILWG